MCLALSLKFVGQQSLASKETNQSYIAQLRAEPPLPKAITAGLQNNVYGVTAAAYAHVHTSLRRARCNGNAVLCAWVLVHTSLLESLLHGSNACADLYLGVKT